MNKIIVHNDLDGAASAALLIKATRINNIIFSEIMEKEKVKLNIDKNTIIADLAFDEKCGMWFDHHISHKINKKFKGSFKLEKSCTRVIYDYYNGKFSVYYKKLTEQLDKADSGSFTKEDVEDDIPLFKLNFLLLSYPFKEKERKNILNKILKLILEENSIEQIIKNREILNYLKNLEKFNQEAMKFLKKNKKIIKNVLVMDSSDKKRIFPMFKIYLLYPKINYLLIINKYEEKNKLGFLIVINNFKNFKYKNIGEICKSYGGGGHKEIGGFRINKENKTKVLDEIIQKLSQ